MRDLNEDQASKKTLEAKLPDQQEEKLSSLIKINSRFGEIVVDRNNAINFKHGILGIPCAISFCLAEMPNAKNNNFKLLQCIEDHELSFIVITADCDNELIKEQHVSDACVTLELQKEQTILLFIVTVHEGEDRHLSINAKAPIFVDFTKGTAAQYVFQCPDYDIRHRIS